MPLLIFLLAFGSYFQPAADEPSKGLGEALLIRTVVGSDNLGDGLDARQAVFLRAGPVATDSSGNLYVSDNISNTIRRIDAGTGVIATVAGNGQQGFSGDGGPALAASFSGPGNIVFGANDDLYVADGPRIRLIDGGTGVITTIAGTGQSGFAGDGGPAIAAELGQPVGIAIDAGQLYFADRSNHVVRRIDLASGIIETFAGTGFPGASPDGGLADRSALNTPEDVAVDSLGRVYISDPPTQRIRVVSTSGILGTAAGTGVFGFSGDGGPASRATLFLPSRLALDSADNLYFTDVGNYRVRRIDARSRFVTTVAGNGASSAAGTAGQATELGVLPVAIAVAPNDELIIAEGSQRRVRRVDGAGRIDTIAGGAGFSSSAVCTASLADGIVSRIAGVSTDDNGIAYVADVETHTVVAIDLFTATMTVVAGTRGVPGFDGDGGQATTARLASPTATAVRDGLLYIADAGNRALRVVDLSAGTISERARSLREAGRFGFIAALEVAADGSVYLADGNRVARLAPNDTLTTIAGSDRAGFRGDSGPATAALLDDPRDLALDRRGGLLIADAGNQRVRRVDLAAGTITTVAGTGIESTDPGPEPAPALAVNLLEPSGVAADADGNLYISDTLHQRIRRVDPEGTITTIAGTGLIGDSGDGGRAAAARLRNPTALAADPFGRVYVNDQDGIRLRLVEARGSGVPLPSNVDRGDRFGQSVAAAGSWFAVGAPNDELGSGSGSVTVYRTDGCRASLADRLEPPPGFSAASFGRALAMTEDRIAVSALPGQTKGTPLRLAIYRRSAEGWGFAQDLPDPDAGSADFASALAIAGDSVVVGAPGGSSNGLVYRYTGSERLGLERVLRPDDGAAVFGTALAADGTMLAVGSPANGRVDVYDVSGEARSPAMTFESPAAGFGGSLAAHDGNLLIGAPEANDAFIVALDDPDGKGTGLVSLAPPSLQSGDRFGFAVAISGSQVVVGAPGEQSDSGGTGSLYQYDLDAAVKGLPPFDKLNSSFFQDGLGIAAALADNLTLGGAPDTADERGDVVAVPAGRATGGADGATGFTVGAQICESLSPVTFDGLQWREQALLNTGGTRAEVVCAPPFLATATTVTVQVSTLNQTTEARSVRCELRDIDPAGTARSTRACTATLAPSGTGGCDFEPLARAAPGNALTLLCDLDGGTGIARLRYSYDSPLTKGPLPWSSKPVR